ncbi:MAG: hypothetical protein ACK5AZ_22715 [Bryobacteraceae bacterium]
MRDEGIHTIALEEIVDADWADRIPDPQWETYRRVLHEVARVGRPFALGGAFALATYTNTWRDTKDLDLYVLPGDRDPMVEALERAGLSDLFEKLPYDRGWIYRATSDDSIVDIIWSMANRRAEVDMRWLDHGARIRVRGEVLRIVPVEEMIWAKMYVLQRDRCDWPDVINLIHSRGPELDWRHLLHRAQDDAALIAGVLAVFSWLFPSRSAELPSWLWNRLRVTRPTASPGINGSRLHLLDPRPWHRTSAETTSYPP